MAAKTARSARPAASPALARFRKALAASTDAHEVYRLTRESVNLRYAGNRFEDFEAGQDETFAVRAIRRGRAAFVVTGDLARPDAQARAIGELADLNQKRKLRFRNFPAPAAELAGRFENPALDAFDPLDLVPAFDRLVRKLRKGVPGATVGLRFSKGRETVALENSAGLSTGYTRNGVGAMLEVGIAEPGNLLELHAARQALTVDALGLEAAADRIIGEAAIARRTVPFKTGTYPVIFSPQALGDILVALEAGLSGMAVNLGLSPIRDKVGKLVLSKKLTLVEDPHAPGAYRSSPIDDEGCPTSRRAVIERGVLTGFLHSLESAAMAGAAPTGNALRMKPIYESRDAGVKPHVGRTNWEIPPGDLAFADMVGGIRDGLLVHTLIGSFIGNVITGDFTGNLWLGFRIRNGKPDGRVKNALVTGNIYDVLGERLAGFSREMPEPADQPAARFPHALCEGITVSC